MLSLGGPTFKKNTLATAVVALSMHFFLYQRKESENRKNSLKYSFFIHISPTHNKRLYFFVVTSSEEQSF